MYFNICFKPASTINLQGEKRILKAKGRHDPCVVPRAMPIVESMISCVILDMLMNQLSRRSLCTNFSAEFKIFYNF